MRWYDYLEEVERDAKVALEEAADYDPDRDYDDVRDDLFLDDSVTGNGSGSYTFSTAKAAENVAGIMWDDEVVELFRDMGYDGIPTEKGPEAVDVIARCIALDELYSTLEDYWEELTEHEEVTLYARQMQEVRELVDCIRERNDLPQHRNALVVLDALCSEVGC